MSTSIENAAEIRFRTEIARNLGFRMYSARSFENLNVVVEEDMFNRKRPWRVRLFDTELGLDRTVCFSRFEDAMMRAGNVVMAASLGPLTEKQVWQMTDAQVTAEVRARGVG